MKSGCFKFFALFAVCLIAVCMLTSCQTSTPATRVQQNPAVFNNLSKEDQDLVLRGTISERMTKDAVLLAWGPPNNVAYSRESGRDTETWRYTTMQAVYRPHYGIGMGYGYGYGYRGHRYGGVYPYGSVAFGPDYVPVTSSVVRFRKGRVVGWDTMDQR
jgi:hypothetical protein